MHKTHKILLLLITFSLCAHTEAHASDDAAKAHFLLCLDYLKKENDDKAVESCSRAIELKPDYAEAYLFRLIALTAQEKYGAAILDYQKAQQLNPQLVKIFDDWKEKETHNQIKEREVASPEAGDAKTHHKAGLQYNMVKDYDKAIASYTKAIALNEKGYDYSEVHKNRGNVYVDRGEYDKALADFDKAIALDPTDSNAYRARGFIYLVKKNKKRAKKDMEKSASLGNMLAMQYLLSWDTLDLPDP